MATQHARRAKLWHLATSRSCLGLLLVALVPGCHEEELASGQTVGVSGGGLEGTNAPAGEEASAGSSDSSTTAASPADIRDVAVPFHTLVAPTSTEILSAFEISDSLKSDGAKHANLGVFVKAGFSLDDGIFLEADDAIRWRMDLSIPGATFLAVNFGTFRVGSGTLRIAPLGLDPSAAADEYRGTDTRAGILWTRPVLGDAVALEIEWPLESPPDELTRVSAPQLVYGVAPLDTILDLPGFEVRTDVGAEIDPQSVANHCDEYVRCYNVATQMFARGVLFITISQTVFQGATGTLLNNTAADCKPYVLTAYHVVPSAISAASAGFYINYEQMCNGTPVPLLSGSSGSTIVASWPSSPTNNSPCNSAATGTDFTLLRINTSGSWTNMRMNGWDARLSPLTPTLGVVHHPNNNSKEVALETNQSASVCANGYGLVVPSYEQGATRNGSSGAALISSIGLVRGQLWGGATCDCAGACNENDVFGWFTTSFIGGGNNANSLAPWLAPGSAALNLEGRDCRSGGITGLRSSSLGSEPAVGEPVAVEVGAFAEDGQPIDFGALADDWSVAGDLGDSTAIEEGPWISAAAQDGLAHGATKTLYLTFDDPPACGESFELQARFDGWAIATPQSDTARVAVGRPVATDVTAVPLLSDGKWATAADGLSAEWSTSAPSDVATLTTEFVSIPTGGFFAFEYVFDTEAFYDSLVLEFRVDGGEWEDAGLHLIENPYNSHVSAVVDSVLANRDVWSGFQGDETTVLVDLSSLAGSHVAFRWIAATDAAQSPFAVGPSSWQVGKPRVHQIGISCEGP